jgi:single-stranded-DNA-specific exonuclease
MNWSVAPTDPAAVTTLARALNLALPAARILWARGYRDSSDARRFFAPSIDDLHDPYLLKGMPEAVERIRRAVRQHEPILLYGDYDVDGTSSVVILKKGIELLGGTVTFHVPHRLRDGYGMRSDVVEDAASKGVKLIVSVDTGIRAGEVVRTASALGIDVIVTDHHLPEEELPPALAVLNPNRRDCDYPEKNLCGAGVALKLIQALLADHPKRDVYIESFLKLVAIATVADVVPLTGENRVIVKLGLEGLREVRNPGLRALLAVSDLADGVAPSAGQIAFRVAPRINAAGRMASASDVIELFCTNDADRAKAIAAQLHDLNKDRQQTEAEITLTIFKQCIEQVISDDDAALVFAGEGWHRGVVGIVASRVVERYHRPVFVLGIENGVAQGSGRSIPAFHLLDALEQMPELFNRFGGHRQAAGLTIAADRVEEFRARLRAHAATQLTAEDFVKTLDIDCEIDFNEIDDASANQILSLAPFGFGNPSPLLVARNVEVTARDVKNDKHVFVKLKSQGRMLRAKAWNFAERAAEFAPGSRIDLAFTIEDDAYSAARGYAPWQIIMKDARPIATSAQAAR